MLTSVLTEGDAVYNGEIWVFGGSHKTSESDDTILSKIQIYNPVTDTWRYNATDMPTPMSSLQAVTIGDAIWLFHDSDAQAYEYRPDTDQWITHTGLFFPGLTCGEGSEVGVLGEYVHFANFFSGGSAASDVYRIQVPEPAVLFLVMLGGAALVHRRRAQALSTDGRSHEGVGRRFACAGLISCDSEVGTVTYPANAHV